MHLRVLVLFVAALGALTSGVAVAQGGGISGVVVDARGKPVGGATVEVLKPKPPGRPLDQIAMIRDLALVQPVAATTTSAADGQFETGSLPPGSYPVVARKSGSVAGVASGQVSDAAGEPVRLVLGAGHRVDGTVVRKDGAPVSGAVVVAFSLGRGMDFDPPDKPLVRTDGKGKFVFDALPTGRWNFIAAPPNEGYSHVAETDVPAAQPVTLTLDGTSTLGGQVTDEDGVPVVGARVVVGFARGFGIDLEYGATTTTDSKGRYELRGLSTASVELFFVQADGFCPHRGRVNQGDEPRKQDVKLARGGTLRGVILAQGTKTPVGGATITVLSAETMIGGIGSATSAADGKFELRGVPMGRSMVMVNKAGWRQVDAPDPWSLLPRGGASDREQETGVDPGSGATLVVARSGDVLERKLEVFRPTRIQGRVLGPDGKPFAGAQIAAVREGEKADRRSEFQLFLTTGEKRPVSDANGRFDVESPAQKGRVVVEANVQDISTVMERRMRASVVVEVDAEKPLSPIEIRLGTGTSIAGKMTDATTGKPVGDVWVGWWNNDKREDQWDLQNDMGIAWSAADGTYRFDVVTSGSVKMEVRSTHDRRYVWASRIVTVEPDKVNTIDWVLEPAKSISGRALFTDGRPAAGAWIDFRLADTDENARAPEGSEGGQADANGEFTIKCLPSGRYRLVGRVGDDQVESEPVIAAAGTTNVELRFPSAVAIGGVVRFKDGTPAVGVSVSPWPADEAGQRRGFRMRSARTAADGTFRFGDLLPGTYNLVIDAEGAPGISIRPKRVNGVAAGTTNLTIELERGLTVVGRVLGPDGAAVAKAHVYCTPLRTAQEEDEPLDSVQSEITAGRFELAGLGSGKHRLVVSAEGLASTRVNFVPGSREIEVRLAKAARVKGRVYLPDGKPANGADIWIEDTDAEGSTSAQCFAGEDGTFELADVGPGVHRVRATEDPFVAEDQHREPHAGEVVGVRVAEGVAVNGIEIRLKPAAPK